MDYLLGLAKRNPNLGEARVSFATGWHEEAGRLRHN
jgi:hypothetical protein